MRSVRMLFSPLFIALLVAAIMAPIITALTPLVASAMVQEGEAPALPGWLVTLSPVIGVLVPILSSHLYEWLIKNVTNLGSKLGVRGKQVGSAFLTAAIMSAAILVNTQIPNGVDPTSYEAFSLLVYSVLASFGWHGVAISPRKA